MNVDVAGDVDTAGKIAPVVLALGLELLRHGGHVVVLPDGIGAADRQPVRVGGDAHRLGKRPEVGIQAAAIVADHDHLACLVRGDDQTDSELVEEGGQIGCVHARNSAPSPRGGAWAAASTRDVASCTSGKATFSAPGCQGKRRPAHGAVTHRRGTRGGSRDWRATRRPAPAARVCPMTRTYPRRHRRSDSRAFCSTSTMPTPAALMSRTRSKISRWSAGDSPADGSSSRRRAGSTMSAIAIASIWRSPPESEPRAGAGARPGPGRAR